MPNITIKYGIIKSKEDNNRTDIDILKELDSIFRDKISGQRLNFRKNRNRHQKQMKGKVGKFSTKIYKINLNNNNKTGDIFSNQLVDVLCLEDGISLMNPNINFTVFQEDDIENPGFIKHINLSLIHI